MSTVKKTWTGKRIATLSQDVRLAAPLVKGYEGMKTRVPIGKTERTGFKFLMFSKYGPFFLMQEKSWLSCSRSSYTRASKQT